MEKPFAEIDHSGDIGIEARGSDVKELLGNATLGLFSLLYRGKVRASVERRIRVESSSLEDLVVDWLSEVVTTGSARGELYGSVDVHDAGDHFAEGVVAGEPFDSAKHDPRFDVKAVTYHGLSVVETGDGLVARVIFDL